MLITPQSIQPITIPHAKSWVYSKDFTAGKLVAMSELPEYLDNGFVTNPDMIASEKEPAADGEKPKRRMGRPPKVKEEDIGSIEV